ncbi:conserved hypothetical protein [Gammaproteobacteria bacterium]
MHDVCVVLAHPRSGSSLLMQTLSILGMPWVGEIFRPDLPVVANPNGYLEDKELLCDGLSTKVVARLGECDGHAMKLSLHHMVTPGREEQWQRLEDANARLLIPIRHPLEIALSRRVFLPPGKGGLVSTITFLLQYADNYRKLAHILGNEFPNLGVRACLVPYRLKNDDPSRYVDRVRTQAGLPECPIRSARAVDNIRPDLYRIRVQEQPETYREWYERTPALRVFEHLCRADGTSAWAGILADAHLTLPPVGNGLTGPPAAR